MINADIYGIRVIPRDYTRLTRAYAVPKLNQYYLYVFLEQLTQQKDR
jgi:hypothetical protein